MQELINIIENAIKQESPLVFSYMDTKGNITKRRVLPKEIKGDKLYAMDLDKAALRSFILNRIKL